MVGKGVPASLLMAVSQAVIRASALASRSPAKALMQANSILRKYSRADFFVSVFLLVLNPQDGSIFYSNGGHCQAYGCALPGECEQLGGNGTTLGVFRNLKLEDYELKFEKGDSLIFYTDGLTEAASPNMQFYGNVKIRQILEENQECSPQEMLELVTASLAEFTGDNPEADDQTILVLKRL